MVIGSNGKIWPFKPIGATGSRFNCIESFQAYGKRREVEMNLIVIEESFESQFLEVFLTG